MNDMPAAKDRKPRRWMPALLFVSLAVNLIILGIVIGAVSQRGDRSEQITGPTRSILGEPYIRALDPNDRRAIGREMVRNRDSLRTNRREIRERVEGLLTALSEETFDRDAVATYLSTQRSLAVSRQALGEELLLDQLEQMTPEDRQAFAARLGREFRRFRRD